MTICFGPPTGFLLVGATQSLADKGLKHGALGLIGLALTAFACMAAFWLVVLMGPSQIRRHTWLRWFTMLFGIVGVGMGLWMLRLIASDSTDPWSLLLLGLPVVVGFRYLFALLRGG